MKEIKLGILDEIKKMMGDRMADKIGKPKEVSVEIEAGSAAPKEEMPQEGMEEKEAPQMEMGEQSGELDQSKLSPEEMMQLKALYEKMC
jgi:hypothetical protein